MRADRMTDTCQLLVHVSASMPFQAEAMNLTICCNWTSATHCCKTIRGKTRNAGGTGIAAGCTAGELGKEKSIVKAHAPPQEKRCESLVQFGKGRPAADPLFLAGDFSRVLGAEDRQRLKRGAGEVDRSSRLLAEITRGSGFTDAGKEAQGPRGSSGAGSKAGNRQGNAAG